MYYECPYCGSSLDPGEKCDCINKKEAPKDDAKGTSQTYNYNTIKKDECQDGNL